MIAAKIGPLPLHRKTPPIAPTAIGHSPIGRPDVTLKDMLKFLSLKLDLEESEKVDLRFAGVGAQEGELSQRV